MYGLRSLSFVQGYLCVKASTRPPGTVGPPPRLDYHHTLGTFVPFASLAVKTPHSRPFAFIRGSPPGLTVTHHELGPQVLLRGLWRFHDIAFCSTFSISIDRNEFAIEYFMGHAQGGAAGERW